MNVLCETNDTHEIDQFGADELCSVMKAHKHNPLKSCLQENVFWQNEPCSSDTSDALAPRRPWMHRSRELHLRRGTMSCEPTDVILLPSGRCSREHSPPPWPRWPSSSATCSPWKSGTQPRSAPRAQVWSDKTWQTVPMRKHCVMLSCLESFQSCLHSVRKPCGQVLRSFRAIAIHGSQQNLSYSV